jgi:basic membrane protein A and related proteins
VLTPAPKEGFVPSLSLLARHRYDLVMATWFHSASALDRVATEFAGTTFAIIDATHDTLAHRPTNVLGLAFRDEQAGYLAGHLAARVLALSPGPEVISSVGGMPVPTVRRFIAGYQAGARSGESTRQTPERLHRRFPRPRERQVGGLEPDREGIPGRVPGGRRLRPRALEAAREGGAWGIGVDVDQSHLGRHILTSAVKRLDVAVFDTVENLVGGRLETGCTSYFSLSNGGVDLGTISSEVPRSLIAELDDVRAEIAAGPPIATSIT